MNTQRITSSLKHGIVVAGKGLSGVLRAVGETLGEMGRDESLTVLLKNRAPITDDMLSHATPEARQRAAKWALSHDDPQTAVRISSYNRGR